mgnify:FL=1
MKYEEMMVERQMVTGKRVLKDIKEVTERIVNEIEVNEMLFEQKICAVHELLKSLKLDFVLDYEDEENEGYSIFILDPELRVVPVWVLLLMNF